MTTDRRNGVYRRESNPVLVIGMMSCLIGVIATYWFSAAAPTVFLIVGAALTYQIWHNKTHGIALIYVENGEIVFLESVETPNKRTRIRVADVSEIAIAGLPDDQRFRFILRNGQAVKLRPHFERQYSEQIIQFLKEEFQDKIRVDIQGPLDPIEEMRGDFKTP